MYCPECGAEYRKGIVTCAECEIPLVDDILQSVQTDDFGPDVVFVTVYKTGNPALIAVVRSLLEDAGIPYYLKNEGLQDLFPVGNFEIEIQVPEESEAEAEELLAKLAEDEAEGNSGDED